MTTLKNKKVFLITLGCRVNIFESNQIANSFEKAGAKITKEFSQADIVLVNTCSVTAKADNKSLYFVNKASRQPKCKMIIVCGCSSQQNVDVFTKIKKVKIIIGTKYKSKIIDLIKLNKKIIKIDDVRKENKIEQFNNFFFPMNTRAYLKIQDGCNFNCTYCLIPSVRGKQRSLDNKIIIKQINKLIDNGYKEIILTGVNTSGYNYHGCDFFSLLKQINNINKSFRVRISSLEPFQINKQIIDLILQSDKFCKFFHLCLQSGSDSVLKEMNRKYTTNDFFKMCRYIRKKNPLASITTDYIVGFPTETDVEFEKSLLFVDKIKFSDMHIFPYSNRPNTMASKLEYLYDKNKINERITEVEKIRKKNEKIYLEKFIDKKVNVLFEENKKNQYQNGYSQYSFQVFVKTNKKLINTIKECKIDEVKDEIVFGN